MVVDEAQTAPLFANSDAATLPLARVNVRERRIIDHARTAVVL
jgi:hypothetical protein